MTTIVTRAGKGSALTWTEGDSNFTNLNTYKLESVAQDTTPQLGGDLNVNGKSITSTSNGNIAITPNGTGSVVIDGNAMPQDQGTADQVLITDGAGQLSWSEVKTVYSLVYNADSTTINKGQPVYLFGANGANPSVKLAVNTGDTTSARTYGLAAETITAGSTGRVITQGVLKNVATDSYTSGASLYLGSTAGTLTATKPYAPNHLVYIGTVTTVNAVSGRILVRIQNGYELDEIHDVNIDHNVTLANKDYLVYNSSNTLWENRQLDIVNDTSPQLGGSLDVNGNSIVSASNGNIAITPNGTGSIVLDGQSWPQADGTSNQVLKTNGAGQLSWTTPNAGTVTSVAALTLGTTGTDLSSSVANGTTTPVITLNVPTASATNRGVLSSTDWTTFNNKGSGTVTSVAALTLGTTGTDVSSTVATGTTTPVITLNIPTASATNRGALSSTDWTTFNNKGSGTVTSVAGTGTVSGISLSGTVTGTGNLTLGGTLDLSSPPAIGGTAASTGRFTTITSTVATGTAPFTVASTTNVANLNASSLNGATFAAPGSIGSGTAGSGAFTTLSASSTVSGTGFSTYLASPPAIGGTAAAAGSFTTLSATTTGTTGALSVTYNPASASGAAINATGKDSQGGVGYFDFLKITNTTSGATNPNKTFRVSSTGQLEIVDSGYGNVRLSLTDAGLLTVGSATVSSALTIKDLRETVYTSGATTGTITPDVANGTVQKITLTGSITFNAFANPVAGQSLTLIITQSAGGGLTLTSTMKFSGGSKTLSTAGNAIDIMTVFYDGSVYYASLAKGFA